MNDYIDLDYSTRLQLVPQLRRCEAEEEEEDVSGPTMGLQAMDLISITFGDV